MEDIIVAIVGAIGVTVLVFFFSVVAGVAKRGWDMVTKKEDEVEK